MQRRVGRPLLQVGLTMLVVAMLGGLILPAIVRIRDAAHLTKCQNNLKRLALAVHNYNDAYQGRLPTLSDQDKGSPTGQGIPSIFGTLVPYIEAGPGYYHPKKSPPTDYHAHSSTVFTYRYKDNTTFTEHGGLANRTWGVFTDPGDATADGLRDVPMTLPDGTTGYYATGSYAAKGAHSLGHRRHSSIVRRRHCEHDHAGRAAAGLPDGGRRDGIQPVGTRFLLPAYACVCRAHTA